MNITKYHAYFHDGSLYYIHHKNDQIILTMSSAEMDPDDRQDHIPFSPDDTLKGKLHIEGIKSIRVNDKPFSGVLKILYDEGTIFDLEIDEHNVNLQVIWETMRPKPKPISEGFSKIEVEADKIYWEPIPDLVEPS